MGEVRQTDQAVRHTTKASEARPVTAESRLSRILVIAAMLAATVVGVVPANAQGSMCLGSAVTIFAVPGQVTVGTGGADVIMGTPGPDDIRARGGADKVCAKGGNDNVNGGGGPDMIDLGGGDDTAQGRSGADIIYGRGGSDDIDGNGGRDRLFGHKGNDELNGGGGNDVVDGGPRGDILNGGRGNDKLRGRGGKDICNGGGGADTLTSCNEPTITIDAIAALLTVADLGTGWTTTDGPRKPLARDTFVPVCGVDLEADLGITDLGHLIRHAGTGAEAIQLGHSARAQTLAASRDVIRRTNTIAANCNRPWMVRNAAAGGTSTFAMLNAPNVAPHGDGFAVYRTSYVFDYDSILIPDFAGQVVLMQIRCGPVISRLALTTATTASLALLNSLVADAHAKLQAVVAPAGVQCDN